MDTSIKNYRIYTPIDKFQRRTPCSEDCIGYRCNLCDAIFDREGKGDHEPECLVQQNRDLMYQVELLLSEGRK